MTGFNDEFMYQLKGETAQSQGLGTPKKIAWTESIDKILQDKDKVNQLQFSKLEIAIFSLPLNSKSLHKSFSWSSLFFIVFIFVFVDC